MRSLALYEEKKIKGKLVDQIDQPAFQVGGEGMLALGRFIHLFFKFGDHVVKLGSQINLAILGFR